MPTSGKVTFNGADGNVLAGRLDMPVGESLGTALFAHCFTCSKDIFAASRIAQGLTAQGFAVLRFDFTGLGSSEGEFANTNFSSNVEDLIAAANYLRDNGMAPDLLIGHSLGGAAVLAVAASVPEAQAVATVGAPYDPSHVAHLFGDQLDTIESEGEAEVSLAGRPFKIKRQFLKDIAGQDQKTRIASLGKALLVFHSPLDDTVGIDNASGIFGAAKHPKSFVSLDTADHLLTRREDAEYVSTVLAGWASRFLPKTDAAKAADKPSGEGSVIVEETGQSKFQNAVQAGAHRLLADEPAGMGGTNTGPSPYDYLLVALGACTNMTLRLYAEHKGLPLTKVTTELHHEKIHASDCAECETKDGKLDRITRTLSFDGDLDDDQRARLLQIADKCPVHRTLHSEVIIDTEAAPPA
ncbi:MAG: alpha/beta fold hydrolase [Pseudomonadota bacterium]